VSNKDIFGDIIPLWCRWAYIYCIRIRSYRYHPFMSKKIRFSTWRTNISFKSIPFNLFPKYF